MRVVLRRWSWVLVLALAACAAARREAAPPPSTSVPQAPTRACALVLGGGGQVFDSAEANRFFFTMNAAVSSSVHESLTLNGFRAEKLILEMRDGGERARATGVELGRLRCGRVVQVAHFMEGPKAERRFGFDVEVLAPTATAEVGPEGRAHTLERRYGKRYVFPLTDEVLRTLRASDVADRIGRDLAASGVLTRARDAAAEGR